MALVLSLCRPRETTAYAVLGHEAIIDSVRDTNYAPYCWRVLPVRREEKSKKRTAMPMAGPLSRTWVIIRTEVFFFSDLAHYVRSGDFILALHRDAKDLDGYAFASAATRLWMAIDSD
jgi:hypothetical protein